MADTALLIELVRQARAQTDFPGKVTDKAVTCLADFLSCAIEAADLPWSRQSFSLAGSRSGPCVIVGEAGSYSAEDAAFANAVRGHGLVREDMHAGSISHMGVVIWPVLLALAGDNPAAKANLLHAAIAGYEIGGRVGRALMTPEMARLFRPTGLIGPLCATLAGAMLLGLDEETTVNAIALAVNTSGGLNEWPHSGADDMYFHPGFAARNAVTALKLAQRGAKGSATALDGVAGLFAAFGRASLPYRPVLYPDGDFEIIAVFNKEAPACNFAQSPCQVALAASRRIAAGDDIGHIHLASYEAALNYPGCNYRGPFHTPCMTITIDEEINQAFPAKQGARLRIETTSGAVIEEALDDVRSASPALVLERLQAAAGQRLGPQRKAELAEALQTLRSGPVSAAKIAALVALTAPHGERAA